MDDTRNAHARPRAAKYRNIRNRALPMVVAATGLTIATTIAPAAIGSASPSGAPNTFSQTNLVASSPSMHAKLVDPNLTNAWGLAATPTSPIWVSDNDSGNATVYGGGVDGSPVTLDLTVPVPGGTPTGQVANTTSAFPVGGSTGTPAIFIVDTLSSGTAQPAGQIEAWNGGASFVVEDSPTGGPGGKTPANAVYTGLALSSLPKAGPELFAADAVNARIDVFDKNFTPLNTPTEFVDSHIPKGYAPYNVQELNNRIYVAYGKQNATKTAIVSGPGKGYVDVYGPNGVLLHRLVSGGMGSPLNAPWGLAIAPKGFGPFAGKLLVGNLGNGKINVFDPKMGTFLGTLDNSKGKPIVIDGLWGLMVGNSAFGGSNAVVFSAGPLGYAAGLLGTLTPAG